MDVFEPGEFPIGSDEWHRGPIRALAAEAADHPTFGLEELEASLAKYHAEFREDLFGENQPATGPLGKSRGVLLFLAMKKICVPRSIRREVLACDDEDLLDRWLARAVETGDVEWPLSEGNADGRG